MKIGNIYDGFDYEQVSTLLNVPRITAEECKQCEAFQFCGLCISACEKDGCLSKATRLSHCRDTRAELEVCMRLLLLKKEQERYY